MASPKHTVYFNLSESDSPGLRRSNLISWYLGEMESEIESEAELLEKKTVVEKVLDRLVHHVSNESVLQENLPNDVAGTVTVTYLILHIRFTE